MRPRISPQFDLGLPRPELISLNQALLVISEGWTPIAESEFRAIECFPPPDNINAKRQLVLGLSLERIGHLSELWQTHSATANELGTRSPNPGVKISEKYTVPADCWRASKVCFAKSELQLDESPEGFSIEARHGDLFQVRNIVVRVEDVEKLCGSAKPTPAGGRPYKSEQRMDQFAYAVAYVDCLDVPVKKPSLIEALLEHSRGLPEDERLGRTVIKEFAGAVMDHISNLMDE
jgi:hypothetical protein